MNKKVAEQFLNDFSLNTKYEFLDAKKNKTEIDEIATKYNLFLPCKDLSIFKGVYCTIGEANKNGAILSMEETKKALKTIRGKLIDKDHLRKNVVGYILDGEVKDDKIVCYGVIFKNAFAEDYDVFQESMSDGFLGLSYELWAEKEFNEDGTYNLKNVEFSGLAILPKIEPACPEAQILEMSKRTRVLEFASKLSKPIELIHLNKANFYEYDMDAIMRIVNECKAPEGEENSYKTVQCIDFENQKIIVKYQPTGTMVEIMMTPEVKITKPGKTQEEVKEMQEKESRMIDDSHKELMDKLDKLRNANFEDFDEVDNIIYTCLENEEIVEESKKLTPEQRKNIPDDMFAVIKIIKNERTGKSKKIRMFPIHDEAHVRNALARLEQEPVKNTLQKLGISIENVRKKILKRAKELNMKDLLKKYEEATVEEQIKLYQSTLEEVVSLKVKIEEIEKISAELKLESEKVIATKDVEIATIKLDLENAKKEAETAKAELAARDKVVRDAEIAKRKEVLAKFAEGMTDDDILDNAKYELVTLKKEKAELIEKLEKAGVKTEDILVKGSADKTVVGDNAFALGKRVQERAAKIVNPS